MQTPQIENFQDKQIPLSDNITKPLQDAQDIPLSQSPPADANQSKKSHLDIEPFLNVQGPSSSSHHIEQNIKVVQFQSSTNKMVDQDTIKKSPEISHEQLEAKVIADQKALEEKKKALEEQEKAIQKSEKLKKMKSFLDDFLQAEDFFTDVVPDSYQEGSKFRVLSQTSCYIEENFVFSIEPKEWENKDCFDFDKIDESLELFFTIEDDNIFTREATSLMIFWGDQEKEATVTYELFQLNQETVKEYGQIINVVSNDFLCIFFQNAYLKKLNMNCEIYRYIRENGLFALYNVDIYIQAYRTVIISADREIYVMDFKENQFILKQFFETEGLNHY
eukprot:403347139